MHRPHSCHTGQHINPTERQLGRMSFARMTEFQVQRIAPVCENVLCAKMHVQRQHLNFNLREESVQECIMSLKCRRKMTF